MSGIRWTVCKSAPRSRQITTPAPHHSFLQAGCPSCGPTNSVKAVPTNRNYKYTQRYHISSSTRQSAATKSRNHCEYRDFGRAAIFDQRIMHKISKVEPLSWRLSSPLMAAFNARAETEIMSIMWHDFTTKFLQFDKFLLIFHDIRILHEKRLCYCYKKNLG